MDFSYGIALFGAALGILPIKSARALARCCGPDAKT